MNAPVLLVAKTLDKAGRRCGEGVEREKAGISPRCPDLRVRSDRPTSLNEEVEPIVA